MVVVGCAQPPAPLAPPHRQTEVECTTARLLPPAEFLRLSTAEACGRFPAQKLNKCTHPETPTATTNSSARIPPKSRKESERGVVKSARTLLPPPLCKLPPLAISPPPHPGDRHFHVFLVNMYCAGLCCASASRMALHCFPISSNQAPVCVLSYSLSKGVVWVCGGQ